jgi:FKBP-type peptidyl-prolyl cis-trans isomerase FkpA/FKBP-type peptidyl-prolyl cis-trans isomerase FklB
MDSVSYALGYQNGLFLSDEGVEDLETSTYLSGFLTALQDSSAKLSDSEMAIIINDFRNELRNKVVDANKSEGQDFLAENLQKEGVMETESGLQYKVIEEGSGARPTASSTVKVNYEGKLIDGTIFDSSYQRGEPIEFPLNRVIKGWTEGLQLMREGATYELYIPSELGYGNQGAGQVIQPGATLIFKVELLEVK